MYTLHLSLGVEPVDKDVMKRPPRMASNPMITRFLIFQVISSACLIVIGTLFIFWREVKLININIIDSVNINNNGNDNYASQYLVNKCER